MKPSRYEPQQRKNGIVSQQALWWAITVDCNDAQLVARFWSALFGCDVTEPGPDRPGWLRSQPLGAQGPFMNFQPVSDAKAGKVRIHVDVFVEDLDSAVDEVVALGGTDTGEREHLDRGRIAVMRDVEGNEFCLLAAPAS